VAAYFNRSDTDDWLLAVEIRARKVDQKLKGILLEHLSRPGVEPVDLADLANHFRDEHRHPSLKMPDHHRLVRSNRSGRASLPMPATSAEFLAAHKRTGARRPYSRNSEKANDCQ